MLRIGFLACALAYPMGVHASASATSVSFDPVQDVPLVQRVKPGVSAPIALTGLPKTLDGLRTITPVQNNAALCDSIRSHVVKDGSDLPFDAASIVAQVLGQGLCPNEPG